MDTETGPNPCFVWIRDATRKISEIGAGNPRLEAEYLMATALGIPRIELWLRDSPPTFDQITRFETLLARRLSREPLQYVLGSAEFAGLTLDVGPGVFIPRSETERLVETVDADLRGRLGQWQAPRIIDVGVGSGAILLSLLGRFPQASGIGIDRDPTALTWAKRNATGSGLGDRTRLLRGDLLSSIASAAAEVVVTNPPYIRLDERDSLAPEIRDHEPELALFGGEDGFDEIRRLAPQAHEVLVPGGILAIEIGITQEALAQELFSKPLWTGTRIVPDLTGRPRIVLTVRGIGKEGSR